ncbi:hypothetical protein [Nonlabens sp.]|uniref:hypothetical protein n=1 Tax=Nonlabens sp. TaxID=1888209 RepID=UPI001BCD4B9D|nr:hypothetical protein [Nonlabens sp.]
MKYLNYTKILFVISIVFISCNSQKKIAGNYSYKTECLGIEMDGSQTVKAWGNGRNRFDVIEQAKKNAVNDVLFNGIYEGKQDCEKRPVVVEVNARQKHEAYFNKFFADNGNYKKFVSLKDERIGQKVSRDRKRARQSVTHGVVIRVLRAELKQQMIKDEILKN